MPSGCRAFDDCGCFISAKLLVVLSYVLHDLRFVSLFGFRKSASKSDGGGDQVTPCSRHTLSKQQIHRGQAKQNVLEQLHRDQDLAAGGCGGLGRFRFVQLVERQ